MDPVDKIQTWSIQIKPVKQNFLLVICVNDIVQNRQTIHSHLRHQPRNEEVLTGRRQSTIDYDISLKRVLSGIALNVSSNCV